MSWKVTYEPELNVVELKYVGINTAQEIYDSSYNAISLSKKYLSHRIFVNASALLINAKRADLFELPNRLYNLWDLNTSTKIAIVEPKESRAKSKAQFYVLATKNLGWKAEIFSTGRKALLWLQDI